MKLFNAWIVIAVLVAACSKDKYVPAAIDAPNRQQEHVQAKCLPMWNDTFVGSKGARMRIRITFDAKRTLTINDGNDKTWLVDGKGHNSAINPAVSYVAICKSFGDQGQLNGVEVQGYKDKKPLFTITYIQNMTAGDQTGNAFDYSDLSADGTPVELADTYAPVTK